MEEASVARRVLDGLHALGAEVVFGLPGVHNLAFWRDARPAGGPRLVNVRHEQTALYAADGWSRATGRLGAALVTTGPGAANTLGAFGEAAMSQSPVLLVATEISTKLAAAGVRATLHASPDQAALFRPLAKAVLTPRSAHEVVPALAQGARVALSAPCGPVYLDIPTDLLAEPARGFVADPPDPPAFDHQALAGAAALLEGAERVVLWAGGGVVQAGGGDALAALADHVGAPVLSTFASRGVLPGDHPLAVGLPPHEPEVERMVAAADLLVVVGSDLDGMSTKNLTLQMPHQMVVVNVAPERVGTGAHQVHAVRADARAALEGLRAATRARPDRRSRSASEVAALRRAVWDRLLGDPRTTTAGRFVASVQEAVRGRATAVCDMAIPGYWLSSYLLADRPRAVQYPVGWGTLGYALPASIGAALGGEPAVAICGDGGIMFALGELATAVQEALPLTILVVDDGGYGMLRFDQDHAGDPHRGVDLVNPDFARLAESFSVPATEVDDVGAPLARALHEAIEGGRPHMVVLRAHLYPPKTTSPRWHES